MLKLLNLFQKSKTLNKSVLLNPFAYLKKEFVKIPELDGGVWVRELKAVEQVLYNAELEKIENVDTEKSLKMICLMVSMGCCDEAGNTLFTIEDTEKLSENSFSVLLKLYSTIVKLNNSKGVIKK